MNLISARINMFLVPDTCPKYIGCCCTGRWTGKCWCCMQKNRESEQDLSARFREIWAVFPSSHSCVQPGLHPLSPALWLIHANMRCWLLGTRWLFIHREVVIVGRECTLVACQIHWRNPILSGKSICTTWCSFASIQAVELPASFTTWYWIPKWTKLAGEAAFGEFWCLEPFAYTCIISHEYNVCKGLLA